MIITWMVYCYKNLKEKKRNFWVSMHPRGQFVKRGRSRLGRDLCRGLNAGDRRKKRRKRKSCAGGRGNKSVRPPRLTVRVSFLLSFNFFRGQLQHWSKNESNATFHLPTRCDETPNVYVFSRVDTKTIDSFGHVLRTCARTFVYWNFHRIIFMTYAFFV